MSEPRGTQGVARYDVVVLGAGPTGVNVADRASAAGLSVAVVEQELVGGDCAYWACVSSKALLRPVIAIADARRVDGAREAVTGRVDAGGVFARRNRSVSDWDDTRQASFLESIGADLFRGHGRLDGSRRVSVTRDDGSRLTLAARHAVAIATGSRPAMPDILGIAEARPWTNRRAPNRATCLLASPSSAAAAESVSRWLPSGRASALRSRCSPGTA